MLNAPAVGTIALRHALTTPQAAKACKAVAETLLCRDRPGDFNQAMMELGATVCTPRGPDCASCPIREFCAARSLEESEAAALGLADAAAGDEPFVVTDLPEKEKKAKAREETVAVRVVEAVHGVREKNDSRRRARGGGRGEGDDDDDDASSSVATASSSSSFLLVRRPEGGLLAGLWEFPSVVMTPPAGAAAEAVESGDASPREKNEKEKPTRAGERAAAAQALVDSLGVPGLSSRTATASRSVGEVVHVFSHIRQTMVVEHIKVSIPVNEEEDTDGGRGGGGGGEGGSGGGSASPAWRWVRGCDMETAGLTSGVRKVYELVQKGDGDKKSDGGVDAQTKKKNLKNNNGGAGRGAGVKGKGKQAAGAVAAAAGKPEESAIGKMFAKQQKRQKTE